MVSGRKQTISPRCEFSLPRRTATSGLSANRDYLAIRFQKQSNFRIARDPGVIHVAEGTLLVRVQKAVLAAYVFYEGIVALLAPTFDKLWMYMALEHRGFRNPTQNRSILRRSS